MAGRFGAIHAAANTRRLIEVSQQRKEAARLREFRREQLCREKEDNLKLLMRVYDTNNSGKLESDQLKVVMQKLNNDNDEVTDEEVNWLMDTCDVSNDGGIRKEELYAAIAWWEHYRISRPKLESIVKKYDTSKTGTLGKGEIQKVLEHLNDNHPVAKEEATAILELCDSSKDGCLNTQELLYAIAIWYSSHPTVSKAELPSVPPPPKRHAAKKVKQANPGCGCDGCSIS